MKLLFSLGIFAFLFFLSGVSVSSFAHDGPSTSSDSASLESTESTYTLPYPGMLPDNPFYFLKEFRDGFIGFLISDPLKKAEFNLLQADKKIASGVFLVREKENEALAIKTVKQGQGFFKQAIEKVTIAEEKGMDTTPVLERLKSSSQKHGDILMELSEETENDEFKTLSKTAEKYHKDVEAIFK